MLVLLSRYYLLTFFFFIPVEAHLNTYEKKKKCYNANFENAARRSYVDPLSDFDLVFFFLFSFFFFWCMHHVKAMLTSSTRCTFKPPLTLNAFLSSR